MKLEFVVDYYPGDRGDFLRVDREKCVGCGNCARFCPREVWVKDGDKYIPKNIEKCVECGACWNICPTDAVIFEEIKGGTGVKFTYG